jgi:HlyD family secretion protein
MPKCPQRRHAPACWIALVLVALSTCCGQHGGSELEPEVTVQAATVRLARMDRTISAEGVLYPIQQASIVPKISAPVAEFHVDRGSRVRSGDLLAKLENRDLAASATEAAGSYQQARATYNTSTKASIPEEEQKSQADVDSAREALGAAKQLYDSRKKLFHEGALARKDFDQAAVGLTQAQSQFDIARKHLQSLKLTHKDLLQSAEGQLAAAKGHYLAAEAQLNYSEIRSPIDGVVTDRPIYPGEMATAGSPLMTIMNLSRVVVRTHIPASQAGLVKIGDPAALQVQGEPGFEVKGKVTVVSPALDPNSTTAQVWVEAPNPHEELKVGSTVQVAVIVETVEKALVVPVSAVLTGADGTTSVMKISPDGHARQTTVETGIRRDNEIQITKGLKAGDKVVSEGAYGLPNGTKVKY